jgi:hypothetical protein
MLQALRPALLALLFAAGCSAQQQAARAPTELQLLPPAEGMTPVLLKQKLTLQARQRQQQFLAVARFERQRLRLVVLLPSGQRLLTLDYDGDELVQESFSAFDLPGREILAIMQFASWPEVSLRAHYRERDGWRVQTSPDERRLLTDSGTALTIAYKPGQLIIDNDLKEYRVIVQTLERTEL